MRRIVTVVAAATLAFGALSVAAPAAHACVGVRCQVECLKSFLESFPGPIVCND